MIGSISHTLFTFDRVERLIDEECEESSSEFEAEFLFKDKGSCASSMHQLYVEDAMDKLERQYNSCINISNVFEATLGESAEKFFAEVFLAKLLS